MERREFLRKSFIAGLAAGMMPGMYREISAEPAVPQSAYDLVAIKGGEADAMFDEAIKHLGGMKNFVRKNQKVVIKPNIGWDVPPELGADTNPKLVARIVKHCYEAGAKEVYVFDNTCDDWKRCYSRSGIEKAVKDAGGTIVPANAESYFSSVDVPKGSVLKSAKVHEVLLESDVFINVPILKSHGSARFTASMKNLMGVVWDRRFWHRNGLHQCIADFATYRKPDLNIVDAYIVMKSNGPRGVSAADLAVMKSQIISTDMVAADTAAAKLFGADPAEIAYIKNAAAHGVGNTDLNSLRIKRIIL